MIGNPQGNGTKEQAKQNYDDIGICYECGKRKHIEEPEYKHNECQCESEKEDE